MNQMALCSGPHTLFLRGGIYLSIDQELCSGPPKLSPWLHNRRRSLVVRLLKFKTEGSRSASILAILPDDWYSQEDSCNDAAHRVNSAFGVLWAGGRPPLASLSPTITNWTILYIYSPIIKLNALIYGQGTLNWNFQTTFPSGGVRWS